MTPLLVFGKTGQVAQELSSLAPRGSVFLGREAFDLCRGDPAQAIARFRPAAVINAAGHTAVDAAELEPDLAMRLNAEVVGQMAQACASQSIPFVHISSDYVFAGDKAGAHVESDPPAPRTAYGRSKACGERRAAEANGAWAVLRTSWVFSSHGVNFLKTMLRLAQTQDEIAVVCDQIGRPTWARDVARAALAAIDRMAPSPLGVLHVAGDEAISWADFAQRIFDIRSLRGYPTLQIRQITSAEYPQAAHRPANSVLAIDAALATLDWRPTPLDQAVAACLDELETRS